MSTIAHDQPTVLQADRLARNRPEGRIDLAPGVLRELCSRITTSRAVHPEVAEAVAAGEAVVAAFDDGYPPRLHPGVPAPHVEVLAGLRARLGLDRVRTVFVDDAADPRDVRALRVIGCPVARTAPW